MMANANALGGLNLERVTVPVEVEYSSPILL